MFSRIFAKRRHAGKQASRPSIECAVLPVIESMEARTLFSFSVPVNLAVGTVPTSVMSADFNGDGKADIVQLNPSAGSVAVSLSSGDGTFQPPVTTIGIGYSRNMKVGDFNNDGKMDLAVNTGPNIEILDGNGDGSFQPPASYYVGATANDIEVGDFNHDGCEDIATASFQYGGTSQIFLNDGTGHLLPPRNLAINSLGEKVEVGDLNGDGNLDLVESYGAYGSGVLYGHGDGTFDSMASLNLGSGPMFSANSDVKIGDFNNDGHADIVNVMGSNVNVVLGNGNGTYQAPVTYNVGTLPSSLAIADLNGDGNQDIVANNGQVMFGRGNGSFYAPSVSSIPGGAIAIGDFNGDGGADVAATAVGTSSGVNVALNANNDVQLLAGATQLSVSAPATASAGSPFAVTVTALDANGNVDTAFQGTVGVSGAPGTVPASYTFSAADNGVHTIANAATLFAVGQQAYSVTSPFLPDASGTVYVQGGAVAKVTVTAPAASVAGEAVTVSVSAADAYGNPTNNYLGTVHFTSADAQAGLPADYTFTAADAGTHAFSVVYKTSGARSVTATDVATGTISGTSNATTVSSAAATSLSVSGGGGYIGSANAVHITAVDAYGNVATGYGGTVHLASSDPSSTTSADAKLTNGVGTFTVTPMTLGAQMLAASDAASSIGGSESIVVTPGWGVRFGTTALHATVAGQPQNMTIAVYDAFGDVSTVYTGYVAIASTDPRASFSYVYFSAADAGVKTVPVTLYTVGAQAVTVSDYYNAAVTTTQAGVSVTPGTATYMVVTPLQGTVAGTSQDFTVSVRDAYGNVATNYTGTMNFASSDAQATLPASYTFTAADAGTHTFSMAFKSSGGQSFTVSDAAKPLTVTYLQRDILIQPAAFSTFSFRGASNTAAGATYSLAVSPTDAFGNAISGYTGTILLTGTDAQSGLPASYTFTAADAGTHIFNAAFKTAGSQSVTVADSANGAISGSTSVAVKAGAMTRFAISTATAATAGVAQAVTVTATDAYGNAAGYIGTVKLSSSDAAATLPASYAFTNKDGGTHTFNVTLATAGNQSIAATDAVNAALVGSQGGIAVTAPAASKASVSSLAISGLASPTAGVAKTFTLTAKDSAGNVVTGYTGTVVFSSSDVKAGLPASYTFTATDAGVHSFSATFKTAGTQSLTAQDAASSGIVGTQSGIAVIAGAATQFVMSTPSSATQGVGFKLTVTAYDAFGNVATGYRGKVTLSSTDAKAGSSSYTFSSGDNGVHTFSYTLGTLGSQTLKLTDASNSSLFGSAVISVLSK